MFWKVSDGNTRMSHCDCNSSEKPLLQMRAINELVGESQLLGMDKMIITILRLMCTHICTHEVY